MEKLNARLDEGVVVALFARRLRDPGAKNWAKQHEKSKGAVEGRETLRKKKRRSDFFKLSATAE